jgi:hypothetical protein
VHKQEVLKLENEYSYKMNKVNEELLTEIKQLHEKTKKVEEERNNILSKYSHVEEKTREAFLQVFKENERLQNEKIKLEREKEVIKEKELAREIELRRVKEELEEELARKKEVVIKSREISKEKEVKQNYTHANTTSNNMYKRFETITQVNSNEIVTNSNVKIDETFEDDKSEISNISRPERRKGRLDEIRQKNREKTKSNKELPKQETTTNIKSNTTNINNSINTNKIQTNKNTTNEISNKSNVKITQDEFDIPIENTKSINNNIKAEPTVSANKQANQPIEDNKPQSSQKQDEPKLSKKSSLENLLDNKPDLTKVKIKHKIFVLKTILPQIEKHAKTLKPNTFLYNPKLLSNINKESIANKFYDILSNETIELIDINHMQILVSELLKSSDTPNINPDVIKTKEFNDQLFMNHLNEAIIELYVNTKLI